MIEIVVNGEEESFLPSPNTGTQEGIKPSLSGALVETEKITEHGVIGN